MKKWFAGVLCVLLIFSASLAGAESAPWLSPWLKYLENIQSGEKTARLEARLSMNADKIEKIVAVNSSSYAGAELIRATGTEYLRALAALLDETAFEIAAEKDRFLLNVKVGDHSIFDVAGRLELTAENMKLLLTTNLLPSFVITADVETPGDGMEENQRSIAEAIDTLTACAKESDGLTVLRDNIENDRRQAEYFLNGADQVTLTSEQYAALLPNAPRAAENSAYGVVGGLAAKHIDNMDGTMDLFAVKEGATYTFTRTPDGYIARMTSTETVSDYQEKPDGQGYEKIEKTYTAVSTATLEKDSVVYDDVGHVNANENVRISVDLSDPDLSRITCVTETSVGWINFARDEMGQRVSLHLDFGEAGMKGEMSADNAGTSMDILLSVNNMFTVSLRGTLEAAGTLSAPDLEGKKEIALHSDDGQNYAPSDADMRLLKDELYNVTRPKAIDFVMTKLPKNAAALTTVLLSWAMQLGR